jgi:hypothetical protein
LVPPVVEIVVKSEPTEPMDYDGNDYDDVFYLGGTGPYALGGDGGEDSDPESLSEKLLDSSLEDATSKQPAVVGAGTGIGSNFGAGTGTDIDMNAENSIGTKRHRDGSDKFDLGQSYRTIRAARNTASCLRQLNPNPLPGNVELVNTGTLYTEGDDRIRLTHIEHDLRNRNSKTFSFDPVAGVCGSCLAGRHAAWTGSGGAAICVAVSDQNFPACLPARTAGKECVRVIRLEEASLQDLTHALVDALGKNRLPKNSVILLGSLSHLAKTGTEHYLNDWVRSRWWIRERLGEDICVLPLVPIWCEGIHSRFLVRSLVESLTWFTTLNATEAVLMKDLFTHILGTHLSAPREVGWMAGRLCFRLPAGLDTRAILPVVSDGWDSWPESVPPVSMAAEKEIVSMLLAKLEEAFGPNLDLDPCLARNVADIKEQRAADNAAKWMMVVGNSHAAKTTRALQNMGAQVELATSKGWKVSADSVSAAMAKLAAADPAPDLIVYQFLDNNIYFVAKEDGSLSLPAKGKDGRYHVQGELAVATRGQVEHILKIVKPLLQVCVTVQKVLILPLPRYCYPDLRCCEKNSHMINSGPDLEAQIKTGLGIVKKTVRSYLFKERIGNVKLIDPYVAVPNLDRDLFADPVHLLQEGYEGLAAGVLSVLTGEDGGDKGADPLSSSTAGNKRIRILSMGSGRGAGTSGGRPKPPAGPGPLRGGNRGGRGGNRGLRFGKPRVSF